MGEFNTVGLEDIIDAFSRREAATVEAVPKMLKAGADVLIEAQRAEAQAMGLNETGGFINSIKATDVKGDDTEKYVEIYPQGRAKHGNDRKGDKSKVRYATIGFVAEYGTSSHAARPYMTVANEKAHEKVVEAQRSIWESLESAGLPAQRSVYTGRDKPDAYYTFLRLLGTPAVNADDEEKERREMYRVTLFHKGDFEAQLDKTKEVLKAAGVYINSIDAESYETETGYWLVPITVEILKEE